MASLSPEQVNELLHQTRREFYEYVLTNTKPLPPKCRACLRHDCDQPRTIESCPWCGYIVSQANGIYVSCLKCAAEGPEEATAHLAVDAWNRVASGFREVQRLREENEALLERLERRDDEVRRLEARR